MEQSLKPTNSSDSRLLDEIIYLASLASNIQVIDPILNVVRQITARSTSERAFSDNDREMLQKVDSQLKDHLLHRDPVRHFSNEDLTARLREHFGGSGVTRSKLQSLKEIGYIFVGVFAGAALTLVLPLNLSATQRPVVASVVAVAILYLGISWLFVLGLRNFSPRLQQAYRMICLGYVATGLSVAVSPFAQMFPTEVIFRYGSILPPFVLANLFIYLGTRTFAKSLDVRSWATNRSLVVILAAVLGMAALFLPHPTVEPAEWWFDATIGSGVAMSVLALGSAYAAFGTSRETTRMYARAMRWFSVTMVMVAVSALVMSAFVFMSGRLTGLSLGVSSGMFSFAGILMMISAYHFRRSSGAS